MTDFYIDTTVAGPGLGTQASPWKNLSYAWTRFGAGTHTVYCTGGDDLMTAGLSTSNLSATALTIVGNWGGRDVYENCYRLKTTSYSLLIVSAKQVTLSRVALENGTATAPGAGERSITCSGGTLVMDRCCFVYSAAASASYYYALGAYNAAANITVTNCIFFVKLITTTPVNGSSKVMLVNAECTSKIANNLYYPGAYSFNIVAAGSTGNGATPVYINCMVAGVIGYATFQNCVTTGTFNCIATNCTIVTKAVQDSFWEDPANGKFTLKENPIPDAAATSVKDKGQDASALVGHSLDSAGNARVLPWDIGALEYGYGAPYPDIHTVTDVSQAADPECIYYGQTPAIVAGNQVSYKETTEANGWPVNIDAQGFPIIDAGGATGTDSFKFNIGRSGVWDPVPPASNTWTFTIAPPGPPVLLTVNNGNPIQAGQTNVPYTGTGFGASPATRTVWLTQGSVEVVQTQVTGNDTGGTFNVVGYETGGRLKYGQAEIKVTVP